MDNVLDWEELLHRLRRADWVAMVSALIAVTSFLANWRVVSRQSKMQAADLQMAHDSDVIAWFHETVDVLADAQETLREAGKSSPVEEFDIKRSRSRTRISAMLDRGRLFFPNLDQGDGHGQEREAGYQGYRQPALDALYACYRVVSDWPTPLPDAIMTEEQKHEKKQRLKGLVDARRVLVSEVFKAIDPRRRGRLLEELTK